MTSFVPSKQRLQPAKSTTLLRWMTCLFVVVAIGRSSDLIPGFAAIPLVKIALGIAMFALFARWNSLPEFHPAITGTLKTASALAVLALVSITWSIWPGQSLGFLLTNLPVLVCPVVLICKLADSWNSLRTLFAALVVASCLLAIPGLLSFAGGRLSNNSMYDTNDLAYVLVACLPVVFGFVFSAANWRMRSVYLGIAGVLTVSVLLTSSRGGMLALVAVALLLAMNRGQIPKDGLDKQKKKGALRRALGALIVCVALGAVVWPQLPSATRQRLASVFTLESDYNISAQTGRVQIWKRGMDALAQRPIGYGIAVYPMVDVRFGGKMFTAHNSFVQLSVELGVLGFILYVIVLLRVWIGLARTLKILAHSTTWDSERAEQSAFCRMLQISLVGNVIAGMFLSSAYFVVHWTIVALALACMSQIRRRIEQGDGDVRVAETSRRRPVIEVGRVLR